MIYKAPKSQKESGRK